MSGPTREEELDSLLLEWECGSLDPEGIERLREILRTDDSARTHFVRLQLLSAAFAFDEAAGCEPVKNSQTIPSHGKVRPASQPRSLATAWRPRKWMLIVASLMIAMLAGRVIQLEYIESRPRSQENPAQAQRGEDAEATAQGVALVTRLVEVNWGADQAPVEVGDALPLGRLALESGYAQVEFFCGATVIVEGPAELEFLSPLLARVHSGRLRAQVPPAARGFSLEVDDLTVVDKGTEFGLSVSTEGANVQVFDGEVELYQPQTEMRVVTAGTALVRSTNGEYSDAEMSPEEFLDIASLESRAAGQRDERFERWRTWSEHIRRDPRLIAYYAFDQSGGWNRRLQSSQLPVNAELDGAIVGAHRVPGRWDNKSGLEFKRPGDRVRVQIPGEFHSLTFACWVKIDSLDRWYNSLFLTDHYNQGEPHWQILDTGQLFFSVRYKADDVSGPARKAKTHQTVLSPPFWKPSLSGRWLHLATTYDAGNGQTRHYLNGKLLHEESIGTELLVKTTRIGAASIGNWSIPTRSDSEFAIRNLNGSIDEFAIFAAALTADEIREMYNNGKP